MRTMAKDPVILGSDGTRVRRQDEIIKDAEKLVDLLFGGNIDDQVDGRSQSTEPSKRKLPTSDPSSRLFLSRISEDSAGKFHKNCVGRADGRFRGTRAPLAEPESSRVTPASSPSTDEPDRLLPSPGLVDCDREPDEVGECFRWSKTRFIWG